MFLPSGIFISQLPPDCHPWPHSPSSPCPNERSGLSLTCGSLGSSPWREFKCSELGQDRGSSLGLVKPEAFNVRAFVL